MFNLLECGPRQKLVAVHLKSEAISAEPVVIDVTQKLDGARSIGEDQATGLKKSGLILK